MDVSNIRKATEWFEVLQTSERSQTAMMTLRPGDETGAEAEAHEKSDQVMLVLDGELNGEGGKERRQKKKGTTFLIPGEQNHFFTPRGSNPAFTLIFSPPPAYPAGTKG